MSTGTETETERREQIVLQIALPVGVQELAAVTEALGKKHGEGVLQMRQIGRMLQIFKVEGGEQGNE